MPLLNALTIPRALTTFPRKWLRANCLATDSIGDCVYVAGDSIGGLYQVEKADPSIPSKMPAIGVITSKTSPTECKVQYLGEVHGVYLGLPPGSVLYVGLAGNLSPIPPPQPFIGHNFVQAMGLVTSSNTPVLIPSFLDSAVEAAPVTGTVQEVPFANSSVLLVNHQRHYHPLVQVILGEPSGWNQDGWSTTMWNLDTTCFIRMPDDEYVTTHCTNDSFWVEFSSPRTGRIIYF